MKIYKTFINSDWLKIIACITMLIDHIGAVFFTNSTILRFIGRIAFPIFCFMLVQGYFKTSNVKKYIIRLLILALLSEIPYDYTFHNMLFDFKHQNVIWTLLFGLIIIYLLDTIHKTSDTFKNKPTYNLIKFMAIFTNVLIIIFAINISTILYLDYEYFGISYILLFYFNYKFFKKNDIKYYLSLFISLIFVCILLILNDQTTYASYGIYYSFSETIKVFSWMHLGSLFSIIPIILYNEEKGNNKIRKLLNLFYPIHIIIFSIILFIFNK